MRPQRAQSPDVLLNHVLSKNTLDKDILSYSADSVTWQPCWDSDPDDAPAVPDLPALPEENDDHTPEVESEFPEDQHTLSTRYAVMPHNRSETVLFDRHSSVTTDKYETELISRAPQHLRPARAHPL